MLKQIGQSVIEMSDDEVSLHESRIIKTRVSKTAQEKKSAIESLERSITDRMAREALLDLQDIDPRTGRTARQQVAHINSQIQALRTQL